jgi:hypothetical protein
MKEIWEKYSFKIVMIIGGLIIVGNIIHYFTIRKRSLRRF